MSLESSHTYTQDLALFRQLGLSPFQLEETGQLLLGVYLLPSGVASVTIHVTCMPAQFWHFEIVRQNGERCEISTGSGALSDFWPSVLLIADGMLVVQNG